MRGKIYKNANRSAQIFSIAFAMLLFVVYLVVAFSLIHGIWVDPSVTSEDLLYISIIAITIHIGILLPCVWLICMVPSMLGSNNDELQFKGVLGSYSFNPLNARLLWQLDNGNVWSVVLFVRWRILFVNSASFPKLKSRLVR